MAPNPRTAFGLVTHKRRAVLFGGILDQEGKVGWGRSGGVQGGVGTESLLLTAG